jgi:hypothetical protein
MKPFNNMLLLGLCKFDPGDVALASRCPESPLIEMPKPWKRFSSEWRKFTYMKKIRKTNID